MQQEFLDKIRNATDNADLICYEVKFYDDEDLLPVYARNFTVACALAMAWKIHAHGAGFGVEWVRSTKSGIKVPGSFLIELD